MNEKSKCEPDPHKRVRVFPPIWESESISSKELQWIMNSMNKREETIAWILKCVKENGSCGVFYRNQDSMIQDIITATRIHRLKTVITYGKSGIVGVNSWYVKFTKNQDK